MAITEKQILNIKEKAQNKRDLAIEAKATVNEVDNNIKRYEEELKELGVDPGKADEKIEELKSKAEELFDEITEISSKWD